MDNFGPIQLNATNMSNTTNNNIDDHDAKGSYMFIIALFPLFYAALFFIIIFYIDCIYIPIKKKINNCRYKYKAYFEQKNTPIVNNKLSKKYIKMLNKSNKKFDKSDTNNTTDICAICMEDITCKEYNSKHTVVPDCGHYFHTNCLNKWVHKQSSTGNKSNCPICRRDIVRQSDMKQHTVINVSYDSDSDNSAFSYSEYD